MKLWSLAGSTALALCMGNASWADVTPEEVWQSWQDIGKAQGQTITAESAERDGDTLTVTGLTLKMDKDGVVVEATIEEAAFTDQGDGSVEVTMSESYPMSLEFPSTDTAKPEPTKIELTISQPGLSVIASGTAAAPSYAFEAPAIAINLDSVDGVDASAADLAGEFSMTELKGTYTFGSAEGGLPMVESEFTAKGLSTLFSGKGTEGSGDFKVAASMADLAGKTKGTYLDIAAMDDFAKALAAGFSSDGNISYGKASFDVDVTDPTGPTKVTAAQESGSLTFGMDKTRMAYGGSGKGVTMTVEGGQMPVPKLSMSYGEAAFDFLVPVAKSDAPQDFKVLTRVVDLALSDEIWGMIDPTAQLPRDPATLVIDATGTTTLTVDLMDEQAMMALGETPPGQLNSANLNQLQLKLAGAELTGSGAMTFDNTDMVTFGGMPAPTGQMEFKLTGGNALLDKLVAMGLIPQDEAAGYRMMVSMFANAVDGEDTLTSTVKVEDKGLFVNGQRMN